MLSLNATPHRLSSREIKLGQILIRKGLMDAERLESVLELQRYYCLSQLLGELLIEQQLISKSDLDMALREQYWRHSGFWVID
ncbi:MAG: hypothetical protein SFY66_11410 [Oculatellaceae cyanobacterium bins.114]|nr:hypothetical protein [Oculatellaceae cyanobacterium bins.114]